MALFHKVLRDIGRELFLYYPGDKNRTPFKICSITFLLDKCSEDNIKELLDKRGLAAFADENGIILSFPVPDGHVWNYKLNPGEADDVAAFSRFQDAMSKPDDLPLETEPTGIPTLKAMLGTWHPMNDTKYLIGVGTGASMAYTLASCYPDNIAAVLAVGGDLDEGVLEKAVYSPVPVCITAGGKKASDYFIKANSAEEKDANEHRTVYWNSVNPLQCVVLDRTYTELCGELVTKVWDKLFKKVRRPNTGAHGDCEPRLDIAKAGFEFFIEDTRLDGKPHTWFTHVPSYAKNEPDKKLPMVMFFHGGSDNPAEAAEMSKFHELGEKEGFITVYPWGTNRCSWNSGMLPGIEDDVGFSATLIKFMIANYQVDPGRVYLSGFSNGAAQAQAVALVHPELIAAICHIDSNWPGERLRASEVDWHDIIPFAVGMKRKKEYDYRIPVWYTYGSREPSYPVYNGSTQQHQYDFWKMYNNIEIKPTPGRENPDPTGCGVKGDKSELIVPSKRHPHHEYDVQRFYSRDKIPLNLYNYVIMREKGHDVAQMDPTLGWNYVRQFRRNSDGSLGFVK